MSDQLDCVVVGAGVVGLAVARSMALAGREVVVIEAEPEIGMHTSSRNSEVIHAGLCPYCEDRHIPYQRIGKLIVAPHEDDRAKLKSIHAQAMENGVDDLSFVDEARIRELEPAVEWLDTIDYAFDESRKGRFVAAILKYFPDLDARKLTPAYTGIRPKLSGAGEPPLTGSRLISHRLKPGSSSPTFTQNLRRHLLAGAAA